MSAKVLITGVNGFTGRHAGELLQQLGFTVIGMVRGEMSSDSTFPTIETYSCDLMDAVQTEQVIRSVRPDYVLHLAGRNSVTESWAEPLNYYQANVMSTMNLLNALRDFPACRILIVSSIASIANLEELKRPSHPYGSSKAIQRLLSLAWGHLYHMQIVTAEPSNLVGPGPSNGVCGLMARYVARAERGTDQPPFYLSSPYEVRNYLDVRDAVRAYAVLLQSGEVGTSYTIGSKTVRSLAEIKQVFQSMARVPISVEYKQDHQIDAPQVVDSSRIEALGWKPTIPFEQSAAEALDYFRAKGDN